MAFQPIQQIGPYFTTVLLMEQFMSGARIEVDREVLAAGSSEQPGHFLNTAAHAPYWVLLAGKKTDWNRGIHPGQLIPLCNELKTTHHIVEQ